MNGYMTFFAQAVERAVKTLVQAILAVLAVEGVTISTVNWATTMEVAGTAAVISILTSLLSFPVTGTPSLVRTPGAKALEEYPGKHEAPEESSSAEGTP